MWRNSRQAEKGKGSCCCVQSVLLQRAAFRTYCSMRKRTRYTSVRELARYTSMLQRAPYTSVLQRAPRC
eukprot:1072756-Heterocapsa_arctica.AAC.1